MQLFNFYIILQDQVLSLSFGAGFPNGSCFFFLSVLEDLFSENEGLSALLRETITLSYLHMSVNSHWVEFRSSFFWSRIEKFVSSIFSRNAKCIDRSACLTILCNLLGMTLYHNVTAHPLTDHGWYI